MSYASWIEEARGHYLGATKRDWSGWASQKYDTKFQLVLGEFSGLSHAASSLDAAVTRLGF